MPGHDKVIRFSERLFSICNVMAIIRPVIKIIKKKAFSNNFKIRVI